MLLKPLKSMELAVGHGSLPSELHDVTPSAPADMILSHD
jgi:hypothetical protein